MRAALESNAPGPKAGTTILAVDDEEGVLQTICESLRDSNFRLITTTSPRRALSILKEGEAIDLLITDLFMPELDGSRLLAEGRKTRPHLRSVLITGLASEDECRKWRRRGETVIWKPWTGGELLKAVAKALSQSNQAKASRWPS